MFVTKILSQEISRDKEFFYKTKAMSRTVTPKSTHPSVKNVRPCGDIKFYLGEGESFFEEGRTLVH